MVGVGSGVLTQLSVIGLTKDKSRRGNTEPGVYPEPEPRVFCPAAVGGDRREVDGWVGYTAEGKCWVGGERINIMSPLVLKNNN